MTFAYLILLFAAVALLAMAIECLLKSLNLLNAAAAILLLAGSALAAAQGLKDLFLLVNAPLLSAAMVRLEWFSLGMTGAAFYFFSRYFPRDERKRFSGDRLWLWVGISAALSAAALSGVFFFRLASVLCSVGLALAANIRIIVKYKKSRLLFQRKQVRYYLAGLSWLTLLMSVSYAGQGFFPVMPLYFIRMAGFVGMGAILLYSVISLRFVNIRKQAFQVAIEVSIGAVASVPAALLFLIVRGWVSQLPYYAYFIAMVPALILTAWLYQQLKHLIKRSFGLEAHAKDTTEELFDRIVPSRHLQELAQNTVDAVLEHIRCGSVEMYAYDREREVFKTVCSSSGRENTIPAYDPFFRHLVPDMEIYDLEIIHFDPRFTHLRSMADRYFEQFNTALVLPIFYEDSLTILLHVGKKLDNTTYTVKELLLLSRIKKIARIILNNIILYDREQESKITKRDLSLASDIQEAIFQKTMPVFSGMDVYGILRPAQGVSGDYLMVEKVGSNSLGFLVADVSGKGFSAALVSMMIHTVARSQDFSQTSTSAIVAKINEVMTASQNYGKLNKTMSFATVFCGFLDSKLSTLFYTNAGHYPLLVYSPKTGKFDSIRPNARPAGIFPEMSFVSHTYSLEKGSLLVLYSDGITEAINLEEEEFGLERLEPLIAENRALPSREIAELVFNQVDAFTEGREQFDDMTLLIIKL